MKKLHDPAVRIRGFRSNSHPFQSKAWLGNTLLKLDKSLKLKSHSIQGFNWGDDEKGGLQLAVAICMELYPHDIAKQVYPAFRKAFLAGIHEDGFDITVDLTGFYEAEVVPRM
jgi:hypothetical protein